MYRSADVRFAVRSLLRQPMLAVMVVSTLAVALAFNVASASVLTALLERPFPYPRLGDLLLVRDARPSEGVHQGHAIAAADFFDLGRSVSSFERLAALRPMPLVISGPGGNPEAIEASAVTANFFSTLSVVPTLGQLWPEDADQSGHDGVVLLSRRLWHSRFGGDPSAVGRDVLLNGKATTVVGILRDEDAYPSGVDAWMPLVLTAQEKADRSAQRLTAIARLRPSASVGLARAQLGSAATQLGNLFPLTNQGRAFDVLPLRREQYEFTAPLFGFVQTAALLVLALAIVNVTNVLVARTLDRRRELAVRSMLGASRRDVTGLILAETAILTVVATILGIGAAGPTLNAIRASLPEGIARWVNGWSEMRVDRVALEVGVGLGLLTALIVGCIAATSALTSTRDESPSARVTRRRTWGRRAVVAGEIGLAAALLLCAAVVVQGFGQLRTAFDGLAADRLLRFTLTSPAWRYPDDARVGTFHQRLVEAIAELPDVEAVGLIRNEPASNVPNPIMPFRRSDARPLSLSEQPRADVQIVSPATFEVLRVAVVSGRSFRVNDTQQSARVAVVSREVVRRFWPDRDPVGTLIQLGTDPTNIRVIGVVGDLRLNWYDPELSPVIYLSDAQYPARTVSALVRTRIDPLTVAPEVRAAVGRIDSFQPIAELQPLSTSIADSLSPIRIMERMLLAGAMLAAALAAIGVYGVFAQFVSQRRREFGVRFAFGATPESIAGIVLNDAAWTAGVGIIAGLILVVPALRLARGLLLGLPALDLRVVLVVVACTLVVVIGAALTPARRAARVDIGTLLRLE